MGLLDAAASLGTGLLDQYGSLLFGGQLVKGKLAVYDTPGGGSTKELEFFLNPSSIVITKSTRMETTSATGNADATRPATTDPMQMNIGQLWFDTYETRESVRRKYIDDLEKLLDYVADTHHQPAVSLVWGKFTEDTSNQAAHMYFMVQSLSVTYSMFLPDATPVRALVTLNLVQHQTFQDQASATPKESPDHAKLYTVRRGDTLQGIATAEYDNPGEWRRIAELNNIDDPMMLRPGTKLLVPPILR